MPETVVELKTPAIGTEGKLIQSIGIETLGGIFTPILPKGIDVPVRKSEVFSTFSDNQKQIEITLFRGNAKMVTGCEQLGKFHIVDILTAPRRTPQIVVTFEVRDGNIYFYAVDMDTSKTMKIHKVGSFQ